MSFDEIQQIVAAGSFQMLVGRSEDTWLEVKNSTPYDLESPAGRYELAKDVSAFANSEGGFLLIGFTTEIPNEENAERISGLDPITQNAFDVGKYSGMIATHVYPPIEDLSVTWSPINQGPGGIGIVRVPPQSEKLKYFLTAKVVQDGVLLKEIVVGLTHRVKSASEPLSIKIFHQQMRRGKDPMSESIGRLEGKIDAVLNAVTLTEEQDNAIALLDARIKKGIEGEGGNG